MSDHLPLLVERIRHHGETRPDALALRASGGERSYGRLVERAEQVAARLRSEGAKPGDRIVLIGRSSIHWLDMMVGAMFARVAFAPLSTALTVEEQAGLIADAAPLLVFADRASWNQCPFPPARRVLLDELDQWLVEKPGAGAPAKPRDDDLFSIIYSSGTTGTPKGIAHSARARSAFVAVRPRAGPGHVTLLSTALHTNFSFLGMIGPLYHGGAVSVMSRFSVEGFLEAVPEQKITDVSLVPVQVRRIVEHPDFDPRALATLDFTMLSGSPLAPEMKRGLARIWPGRIVDSYGTTETGGIATLDLKADFNRLDTVGRIMPGVEVVILDEDGKPLSIGETGEIVARTPLPMDGYHNQDMLTKGSGWLDADGRRFFRTGDIGRLDADGYLSITGRSKDMIISGGLNLYACDIERILDQHEAVMESAVIAIPDREWGERPHAIVVLRDGFRTTPDELMQWLDGRIARTSRPAGIDIVASLPRNEMGKVLKRALREPFWAGRTVAVA